MSGVSQTVARWLPIPLRLLLVWLLAPSAFFKFSGYSASVGYFAGLGIPAPEIMVGLVATFEGIASVALILGFAGRLACLPVVAIMVVAMITSGVVASNVAVLLAALGIILLGTGGYSLWKPEEKLLSSSR